MLRGRRSCPPSVPWKANPTCYTYSASVYAFYSVTCHHFVVRSLTLVFELMG